MEKQETFNYMLSNFAHANVTIFEVHFAVQNIFQNLK